MKKRTSVKYGPCPCAARLLICGEILILAAIFDFAARLDMAAMAGAIGAIHRMSHIGGTLSASAVILCAAAIGLDHLERSE